MDNKTILPLNPVNMVEFFKDKSQHYVVDVDASLKTLINERSLLLYVSNLQIDSEFDHVSVDLVKEYIKLQTAVKSEQLQLIHANILHYLKHAEWYVDGPIVDTFSIEHIKELISDEEILHILQTQMLFLDSMLLYILTRMETDPPQSKLITTTTSEGTGAITFSLVELIGLRDFLMCYLSSMIDLSDQVYFSKYFDELIFKGQNLFTYVSKSSFMGLVAVVCNSISDPTIRAELEKFDDCMLATITNAQN